MMTIISYKTFWEFSKIYTFQKKRTTAAPDGRRERERRRGREREGVPAQTLFLDLGF